MTIVDKCYSIQAGCKLFVALAEIILVFRMIKGAKTAFELKDVFKLLVFIMGAYLLFGVMHNYLDPFIDWRINILIGGLASLAWAEVIGFLELRGIFKLLKSKPMK